MYEQKEVKKEIYRIIIPMILENMLQISAGLVTTAMVGRLLADDISAQGICLRITDTLWCLYKGIAIGATVLIARAYGARRQRDCRHIAEQTLASELILVLGVQLVLLLKGPRLLRFFSEDGAVLALAGDYLHIILFGFPFVVVMTVVTASFQGYGNTKTPMYIAAVMNLINILLGFCLIFGHLGLPPMGIRGAALALVLSQGAGAWIGLFLLYHPQRGLFGALGRRNGGLRPDGRCILKIYKTGIPAALESMFWQLSAMILSKIILSYGSNAFAAYQLGIQAETITEMPAIGFGTAATTLAARAMGQKEERLRRLYFRELVQVGISISAVTSLLLLLLPRQFMRLMTDKAELQAIGVVYVFVMGFVQMPQNLSRIYNGTLRAMGHVNAPMLIAGFGIWVVRIPLCVLAAYVLHSPLTALWLIVAADQLSRFGISVCLYHRADRKQIKHAISA